MGGKHLKKLRAEKSKVKLKKKKTLPKGQNITDTSFKVKKIVTVEQLKKVGENEPVSSWNVPLKDLLIRLNHYNYTTRLNGLTGLRELITNYPDILTGPSLRSIITKVLELLTDLEHKIRVTAIGLLNYVFSQLQPISIAPFHDIFIVHLGCAMTHREVAVQQDSFKFIDVIISHAPEAVKRNFNNLLQNFIRILKNYLYGSRSEMLLTKNTKLDIEKTRTDMFLRFYQILATAYLKTDDEKSTGGCVIVKSSEKRFPLRGLNNEYKKNPDLSLLFMKSRSEGNFLAKNHSAEFQTQCALIVPLLFDAWAEFSPSKKVGGFTSEYVLSEGVATLLQVLLKILLLLYEKTIMMEDSSLESWFVSTYGESFKKSFVMNFPYMPPISSKKLDIPGNGASPSFNASAYMSQNLMICYMSYCFNLKFKNSDHDSKMERYVTNAVAVKNVAAADILAKVIEAIISSPQNKQSDIFITTIAKAYSTTGNPQFRKSLFNILANVCMNEKFRAYHRNASLVKWMKGLPDKLLKPRVTIKVVETFVKMLARPMGADIVKELESKALEIVQNLPHIKIEDCDQFEGQKLIANVLYKCSKEVLEEVFKKRILQKSSSYPQELRSYMIDIFSYRLTGQSNYGL